MATLSPKRPDDNKTNKNTAKPKYSNWSIDDLLDERNDLKRIGESVDHIDKELSARTSFKRR